MKLFNKVYVLCFLAIIGCSSSKNNDSMTQREQKVLLELLPPGAKNIKTYDKTLNGYFGWIKWEFEGECFLSRNLYNYQAVLTKVDCK